MTCPNCRAPVPIAAELRRRAENCRWVARDAQVPPAEKPGLIDQADAYEDAADFLEATEEAIAAMTFDDP